MTAFAAALAAAAGNGAGTCVLLALAVLAGQVSIGWSNDRIDAARDRRSGRPDKPLARAGVSPVGVDAATAVALVAAVALSFTLGVWAAVAHLGAIACGWAYNLGLKSTVWSWAPFAVAFGALPAIATLALPGHPAPAPWLVGAGALLGVAAHLTNVLPDLADDRATGVVGLAHRLGSRRALALAIVLLVGASVAIIVGPRSTAPGARWAAAAVVALLAAAGARLALRSPASRWTFVGLVALVGTDLALLVLATSPADFLLGR